MVLIISTIEVQSPIKGASWSAWGSDLAFLALVLLH